MNSVVISNNSDIITLTAYLYPSSVNLKHPKLAAKNLLITVATDMLLKAQKEKQVLTTYDIASFLNIFVTQPNCRGIFERDVLLVAPAITIKNYNNFILSLTYIDTDDDVHKTMDYRDIFNVLIKDLSVYNNTR